MPHPTSERVKREAWREVRVYESYSEPSNSASVRALPIFPAVSQATCQCENGLVNGKAEAPPVLSFGEVALFRIFGNATFRRSENPPSGPLEVALFRIKENYRWLRLLETFLRRATVEARQVR